METLKFLAQVAHILETEKFVSTKDAKATSTESTGTKAAWDIVQEAESFSDENLAFAQEALDYVRGYTGTNKYLASLQKSAAFDDIGLSQADRVAWVIPAFLRNAEEQLPGNLGADSKFVGTEGAEVAFIGTVAKARTYVRYGKQKQVVTLLDEKGNIFVWFPSNKILPVQAGDCVKVFGKVKAHNVYNEVQQTVLTRAVLAPFVRK